MLAVVLCEKFGWTYEEYINQPSFFIDLYIEKLKVDEQQLNNSMKSKK